MNLWAQTCAKALGIPIWRERDKVFKFQGHLFKIGVRCCIILSSSIQTFEEGSRVMAGMVKVLEIPADDYTIGWPIAAELTTIEDFCQILGEVSPETILFMGRDLGFELKTHLSQELKTKLYITSHPDEIIKNPREKRQAYEELLALKTRLLSNKRI